MLQHISVNNTTKRKLLQFLKNRGYKWSDGDEIQPDMVEDMTIIQLHRGYKTMSYCDIEFSDELCSNNCTVYPICSKSTPAQSILLKKIC